MLIHYRHASDPDKMKNFDTTKAYKKLPLFWRGGRTLTEYTKFEIQHMNDDLMRKNLLYFTFSYPVGNDIIIKNHCGTCDAKEVLAKNGFDDLSSNISCMTHKIFFKESCFYCFIGWNKKDDKFNGSVCIRKLWEDTHDKEN